MSNEISTKYNKFVLIATTALTIGASAILYTQTKDIGFKVDNSKIKPNTETVFFRNKKLEEVLGYAPLDKNKNASTIPKSTNYNNTNKYTTSKKNSDSKYVNKSHIRCELGLDYKL